MDGCLRRLDPSLKVFVWIMAILLAAGTGALLLVGPIPQDPDYHRFADQRSWLKIPRFGDTATNIFFVIAGVIGLRFTASTDAIRRAFAQPSERRAFLVFFGGVFLTGFGSTWYHLQPDDIRLFWDRLPMTFIFMGLFSAIISEHISPKAGATLLTPLVLSGAVSVIWWAWTEHLGAGDLRWYGLAQFFPLPAMAGMLLLLPSRYTHSNDYWGVLGFYAAAKAVEILDQQIFELTGTVSGHSMKHALAAAAAYWVFRMLKRRSLDPAYSRRSTQKRDE